MRLLIFKLGLFFAICLAITTVVLIKYGGNIDYFYEKFTTPKAKSMIIGDSRSLQGIQPRVMNQYFDKLGYELPVFNYSFTIAQSIIGPLYNTSIQKKLDETSKNGIFIISITPEMLTSKKGYDNTKGEYREKGQPPHNMNFVCVNPNYEYFIKNLSFFHFKGVFRKKSTLHKDGWLEETNLPKNKEALESFKKHQIDLFLNNREDYKLSQTRIQSLHNLVQKLEQHGSVFLVRMPIDADFLEYEKKYYPEFNEIIDSIAVKNNVPYLDFNNNKLEEYNTYDGHHLDKFSGKIFTKNLCDTILYYFKNDKGIL